RRRGPPRLHRLVLFQGRLSGRAGRVCPRSGRAGGCRHRPVGRGRASRRRDPRQGGRCGDASGATRAGEGRERVAPAEAGGLPGAPASAAVPGAGGFRVEVAGEDGALLQSGELRFSLNLFATTFEELETLAPLAPLEDRLTRHDLGVSNPYELTGLPPCSLIVQASAADLPPGDEVPFRVEAGRITPLRIVLPPARALTVRVV